MNQGIITKIVLQAWDQAYESGARVVVAEMRGWLHAQMEQGKCVPIQKALDALEDCEQSIPVTRGDSPPAGQHIERPHESHPPTPSVSQGGE